MLVADEKRFDKLQAFTAGFLEAARELLAERPLPVLKPSGYALKKEKTGMKRVLNLAATDRHFGSRIDGREQPTEFTKRTEARRWAHIVRNVLEYKTRHRAATQVNVYDAGDNMQGHLDHPQNAEPLAEQWGAALHYDLQAINHLAAHYPKVEWRIVGGNHDRIISVHRERATVEKWNNYATFKAFALRAACANLPNVSIIFDRKPHMEVPVFNWWFYVTHGDTQFNPGNPGRSIDTARLASQLNTINASGVHGKKFDLFLCGHVHQAAYVPLAAGRVVVNGAMVPADGYAMSQLYLSPCSQWLWESTAAFPWGDARNVELDKQVDQDSSLDDLITPFSW